MPGVMTVRSRRAFLQTALAVGASPLLARALEAPAGAAAGGTRLVLLGTKGGPTPSELRAAPANVLIVDGRPYVIDCGNGVAIQLTKAGVKLAGIDHVFLTHQHSDHNADLGNLVLLAWAAGLRTRVHLYGPPPIARMIDDFVSMNAIDIDVRVREEGRPPLRPLIGVTQLERGGVVMEDDRVRVTAALVDHYTLKPSFAYRFDARTRSGARSVVFSGDTAPSASLVELARGADVLVHEVMYKPALEKLTAASDNAPTLLDHLLKSHTTTEQVGKIAAAAGVKMLVLSHLVPGADPTMTDEMWTADVRKDYGGTIVVGRDLMVI
jgi:ribonuclease BN (tRNA processing enzyme)